MAIEYEECNTYLNLVTDKERESVCSSKVSNNLFTHVFQNANTHSVTRNGNVSKINYNIH